MPVEGHVDAAFAAVRDVFAEQLASGADLGAAVCVQVDGRTVLDLWGGVAESRTQRPWRADTAAVVFSATKAMTGVAALQAVERGELDLDAPVADVWPEFGADGKDAITTRHLLSHRAGLPAFDRPVTSREAADDGAMAALLARQRPEWTPGTTHGYHALTYGWLVGEVVRRATGRPMAQVFRESFGLHLGGADDGRDIARIAAAKDQDPAQAADVLSPELAARYFAALADGTSPMIRATANPGASFNDPVVRAAGWPAAGLIASARELAGFYRQLLDGELLSPVVLAEATREHSRGPDRTLITESAFGLGFMLPSQTMHLPDAARVDAFGHTGASGALGIADRDRRLAFGYVPNLMRLTVLDRRAYRLLDAVYSAL